jgi:hypothetical protein
MQRGTNLEVIMGDARLSMARERANVGIFPRFATDNRLGIAEGDSPNPTLEPSTIGKIAVTDSETGKTIEMSPRERYYKVIVVDAFSSDAIPVHLCTLEAIDLYLHKMAPDGVLCMHTSNRHMNLILPIAKIVDSLNEKYKDPQYKDDPLYKLPILCKVGKDFPLEPKNARDRGDRSRFMGLFSSEYVMIYHDVKYLKPPDDYASKYSIYEKDEDGKNARSNVSWTVPRRMSDSPWTDDYSNIVGVIRWPAIFGRTVDD